MESLRNAISVGMGELHVTREKNEVLSCVGLGSCIALCAYDPVSKIGGMVHMVLPNSRNGDAKYESPKYVNTGIPLLLQEMKRQGAVKSRLNVKIAGGARMFTIPGSGNLLDVGGRNIEMTQQVLAHEGIKVSASDMGGNKGRTIQLFIDTGKVFIKAAGSNSVEL